MQIEQFLEHYKCFETKESDEEVERILKYLDQSITQFTKDVLKLNIQPKLFTLGSYRLGLHSRGSGDVDVVCVGPKDLSMDTFFDGFYEFIQRETVKKHITHSRLVKDALVPVLKLVIDKKKIDLLYARIPRQQVPNRISDLSDSEIAKMDDASVESINGVRDAEFMEQIIPDKQTFKIVNHFIKLWAKRRGIYSNSLGYFGGYTWRLLVLYICLKNPKGDAENLISEFFKTFSQLSTWNLKNPICVSKESENAFKTQRPQKNQRMLVITPVKPFKNSCRNITKSTFKYLIKEFERGNNIVSKAKSNEDLKKLFKKTTFFKDFNDYIQLDVIAGSKNDLQMWVGWVESRMVSLFEKLDNLNIRGVPFCYPLRLKKENCTTYFIGVEHLGKPIDFSYIVYDFINQMNEVKWKNDDMYIVYKKLTKEELPNEVKKI